MGTESRRYVIPTSNFEFLPALRESWRLGVLSSMDGNLMHFVTYCRPPTEFIPPVQEPYQYIIFRASEVKDLSVDEPAPLRSVHDDPAVLGVCHSRCHVNFHNLSSSIPHLKYNNIPEKMRPWGATLLIFSGFS